MSRLVFGPATCVDYTCTRCGIKDQRLVVPARRGEDTDMHYWLFNTGQFAMEDHARRSPDCPADDFDLKVPTYGLPYLGAPIYLQ